MNGGGKHENAYLETTCRGWEEKKNKEKPKSLMASTKQAILSHLKWLMLALSNHAWSDVIVTPRISLCQQHFQTSF